jgi:hypothetical protein
MAGKMASELYCEASGEGTALTLERKKETERLPVSARMPTYQVTIEECTA